MPKVAAYLNKNQHKVNLMKLLFDLFPVLLFFIAYKLEGIYVATAVAIAASALQVIYLYIRYKKVENMHLITLALMVILGGTTLLLHDETFIKWKPTLINWGFAVAFLASHFIGNKPIIKRMMDKNLDLAEPIWQKLSFLWIGFFIFSGSVNLYVAFNYDTDTWVNFKLFGLMGLTLAFIILQAIYISRYIQPSEAQDLKELTESQLDTLAEIELDAINDKQPKRTVKKEM